jgi:hypothetical protein
MERSLRLLVALGLLTLAPAMAQQSPRRPRGIYALVNIMENINVQRQANPSITPAQLEAFFVKLYQDLLGNPAVSGLVLYENWGTLNPNPPTAANAYDWSLMDDAFNQASAWNSQNLAQAQSCDTISLASYSMPTLISPGERSIQSSKLVRKARRRHGRNQQGAQPTHPTIGGETCVAACRRTGPFASAGNRSLARQLGARSRIQRELGRDDGAGHGMKHGGVAGGSTAAGRRAAGLT